MQVSNSEVMIIFPLEFAYFLAWWGIEISQKLNYSDDLANLNKHAS